MNKYPLSLLLHNIRSVYNTAAIFRTAECLGVEKIYLSGYTPAPIDRFGRARSDFNKVSLGTENIIPWEQVSDHVTICANLQREGYKVIALEQAKHAVSLKDFKVSSPILLIPGTETTGVEESILKLCDAIIEIKQRGVKESLNVHAATAIALWKLLQ